MSFISLITGSFRNAKSAKGVFIETEPYEKGFADYYEKNLKTHIQSYEAARIKALEASSVRVKIAFVVFTMILVLDYLMINSETAKELRSFDIMKIACTGTVIAILFLYSWTSKFINDYQLLIKSKIFPNIIAFCGQYKYIPQCDKLISWDITVLGLIPRYDRETSQDYICGKYEGITIRLFQTLLETVGSKGRRSTVFKGIIIWYDLHKNFKGRTIIKKDLGTVRNFFKSKPKSFEYIKLEDPKFEEMFEVYSTDQVEASYLLTVPFMEKLLNFTESLGGTSIECGFYDSKLVMVISTDKLLIEPGSIYESEDFTDDAKIVLRSMNTIVGILDHLKAYQNMGIVDQWKLYQNI